MGGLIIKYAAEERHFAHKGGKWLPRIIPFTLGLPGDTRACADRRKKGVQSDATSEMCVYPRLFLDGSKTVKGKLEFLCASPWLTGTESEVWLEFKLTSLLCGNIYR